MCSFRLDDGRLLLGHHNHVFHEECLMSILRSNPMTRLKCPVEKCRFEATHINGESIAMVLRFMGIKPVSFRFKTQSEAYLQVKRLFDLEGFMALGGVTSLAEAGRALTIIAYEGDDGRKIVPLLKYFESKGVNISEVDRGEAALAVMERDHFIPFLHLIKGDQAIDCNHFLQISMQAVTSNKLEYIHPLWSSGKGSPCLRSEVIKQALKSESFEAVREMLMADETIIPAEYMKEIFGTAAQFGRRDLLELLQRQPIDSSTYERAIQMANLYHFSQIEMWLIECLRRNVASQ
jgi:hypothetical protein